MLAPVVRPVKWIFFAGSPILLAFFVKAAMHPATWSWFLPPLFLVWWEIFDRIRQLENEPMFEDTKG